MNSIRLLHQNKLIVSILSSVLFLLMIIMSSMTTYAAAKTEAYLDDNVPNFSYGSAKAAIITWEEECTNQLIYERANPNGRSAREIINAAAYNSRTWLSKAGDPDRSDGNRIVAGTTSIPMQINQMHFLCAIVTSPPSGTIYPLSTSKVSSTRYPNERGPAAVGSGINEASKFEIKSQIKTVNVTGVAGATVSYTPNSVMAITRDNNSRYWPANPYPFTVNIPANLAPGSYTITVNVGFKRIDTYHAYGTSDDSVSRCVLTSTGSSGNVVYNNFNACETRSAAYNYTFVIINPGLPSITVNAPQEYEKGTNNVVTVKAVLSCGNYSSPVAYTLTNTAGIAASNKSFTCSPGATDEIVINANQGLYLNNRPVGSYKFTAAVTTPAGVEPDDAFLTVYTAPFTQFYGNDVQICGDGVDNRFVYNDTAGISDSRKQGSFSEYASIYSSNNDLTDFFSGLATAANYTTASGLYPSSLASTWLGQTCTIDTIEFTSTVIKDPSGAEINGFTATTSTTYYQSKDSVSIKGNISTNGSGNNPFAYPVVLIYSEGDINIDPSVTYIEAVLVAKGSINTCSGVTQPNLDSLCNTPLFIRGAAMADTIRLQRVSGTRLLATIPPVSPLITPNNVTAKDTSAAEIFEYPWYLNYANLNLPDTSRSQFDAYFSLPPRI